MKPLELISWAAALFLAANLFPHSVALRLLLLSGGVALIVSEIVRARLNRNPLDVHVLPPLLVPIVLWAAWAALSIVWSGEPDRSQKEFRNEVVYAFLGLWLCYVGAQVRGSVRVFGTVLTAGAVLTSLVGLYEFHFPTAKLSLARMSSGPGDQSSALLTLMPCSLIAIWMARRYGVTPWVRWTLCALPLLFLAAAYATLNRTVWLGFAVQFVVFGALILSRPEFKTTRTSRRARIFAASVAAAILASGIAVALHVQEERIASGGVTFEKDPRLELWLSVLEKIEERPLTGYGFGRGILRGSLRQEFGNIQLWHPHNLLLATAVQLGLPGVALLLLLLGATVYRAWKLARGPDLLAALCGAALMSVVAGMLVRNMTDTLLARQNALLFWGIVAMLLAWGSARQSPGPVVAPGNFSSP